MTVSRWEREVLTPSSHEQALMEAFERSAEAGADAKRLLASEGVVAALRRLLGRRGS